MGRAWSVLLSGVVVACSAVAGAVAKRTIEPLFARHSEERFATWMPEWREVASQGLAAGPASAPVQIVEFVDFLCPVCRTQHPILADVARRFGNQVRVTYVHVPLEIHPFALAASVAVECANRVSQLEAFVDGLFARQDSAGTYPWEDLLVVPDASTRSAFGACLGRDSARARVDAGRAIARAHRVTVTPTLVINGWRFGGLVERDELIDVVERALAGRAPANARDVDQAAVQRPAPQGKFGRRDREGAAVEPGPVPLAVTQSTSPDFDLTGTSDVELLGTGHIVALATIGPRLLAFRGDGSPLRALAPRGTGPGHVSRVANMTAIKGDTLIVVDGAAAKLVALTAENGVVREQRIDGGLVATSDRVGGVLPGGAIVLAASIRRPAVSGAERLRGSASVSVVGHDGNGTTVATVDGPEFLRIETRYRGRLRSEMTRVRLGGAPVVTMWDTLIVTVPADRYRLEFRTRSGQLLGSLEDTSARRPTTESMRVAVRQKELARLRSPGTEALIDPGESERLIRVAPFAESLSPVHSVHVSREDDQLWVVDAISPVDTIWTALAFRRSGAIATRVRGSLSMGTPVAFRGQRVVLRHEDDDGLVTLRVHPLRPRR